MARKKTNPLIKRLRRYMENAKTPDMERVFLLPDGYAVTNGVVALKMRDGLEAERVSAKLADHTALVLNPDDTMTPAHDMAEYGPKVAGVFPNSLESFQDALVRVPEWLDRLKAGTQKAYVGLVRDSVGRVSLTLSDSPDVFRIVQAPFLADFAGQTVRICWRDDEGFSAIVVTPENVMKSSYSDSPWIALIMPVRHDPGVLPAPIENA